MDGASFYSVTMKLYRTHLKRKILREETLGDMFLFIQHNCKRISKIAHQLERNYSLGGKKIVNSCRKYSGTGKGNQYKPQGYLLLTFTYHSIPLNNEATDLSTWVKEVLPKRDWKKDKIFPLNSCNRPQT